MFVNFFFLFPPFQPVQSPHLACIDGIISAATGPWRRLVLSTVPVGTAAVPLLTAAAGFSFTFIKWWFLFAVC